MRIALFLTAALGLLAACGADAPPFPKEPRDTRESTPGAVTVTGEARIGVTGTF